ncbi:MAG: rhodanese-like domain-containing protein [Methanomassiliicoccales archaeon]
MQLHRIESEGLAHFSYLLIDGTDALVVDPRRDVDVYLELAAKEEARITRVLETHRNEDYVIGSMELMESTGAEVLHGPGLDWDYGGIAQDGEKLRLGSLEIMAIHTPGHTEESMCYALFDRSSGEDAVAVFTGDTLFVGNVGRTDLPGPEKRERLSRHLFTSIHEKIIPLGDGCMVLPGHGAGSVCGGDISERPFSTIGLEKKNNPMLNLSEEDFVRLKMEEQLDRPPYFRRMETLNLRKHAPLQRLPSPPPLSPKEFKEAQENDTMVLDTRMPHSVAGAYIKGATSIWLDGLPLYGGWLLPYDRPILLVLDSKEELERAVRILVRIGYDNIIGYLHGGMAQWCREGLTYETLPTINVKQANEWWKQGNSLFIDPRPRHEREVSHIPGTKHIFVGELESRLAEIPQMMKKVCICSAGFRGAMAAVMLRNHGFDEVYNVLGGLGAWKAAGYPIKEK